MTALEPIFNHLGLTQYLHNFIEEGFDTWETVLYITESDLDVLKVKLGHRRRLQREIAKARGISFEQLVASHLPTSSIEETLQAESEEKSETKRAISKSLTTSTTTKRKYRRHPKPDEFAPERPPSAYVIFSNKIRDDLRSQNLSFTEIAKRVGENWQTLTPEEREPYESQAAAAKEVYNAELARYKKTDEYRDYCNYLQEFKQRNSTTNTDGKRPKLDTELSNASSVSTGSLHQGEGATTAYDLLRLDSANSQTNSPPSNQGLMLSIPGHGPPSSFRGGPSPSMHLPPISQSIGTVSSLATAGHLGATNTVETSAHRGAGHYRTQAYPIMTMGERKESLEASASPPIKHESTVPLPMGISASNARRSMNTPASFLRKDTTASRSTSSRSANYSSHGSHGSHGSSAYSPITPMEDHMPSRALPLPPMLAAQPPVDSASLLDRAPIYTSPALSSSGLPQPMQRSQIPSLNTSYSMPSPSERTLMRDLSIDAMSPDQRTLRSHSRVLQHPTQTLGLGPASTSTPRPFPASSDVRDRRASDSPPDPNADPLAVLAYAGRIVGRDVQKPP